MNLRPMKDLIYVKPLVQEQTGKIIVIPADNSDTFNRDGSVSHGEVIKVGPKCETIKPGDRVIHNNTVGLEFECGGEKYITMHENEPMAVLG